MTSISTNFSQLWLRIWKIGKKFKIFNTNNLWFKIDAVDRLCKSGEIDDMEVIVNGKTLANGKFIPFLEISGFYH